MQDETTEGSQEAGNSTARWVVGKTLTDQELIIRPVRHLGVYRLEWSKGGKVPDVLTGTYTSIQEALHAGEKYLIEASAHTRMDVRRRKAEEIERKTSGKSTRRKAAK